MMEEDELAEFLQEEFNYPFSGWDFTHLKDRMVSSPLPWSYVSKVITYLKKTSSLLDMGTGGGEFLETNFQPFPALTCVTEAYPPNVLLAKNRLRRYGIETVQISDKGYLPFKNGRFELIINQHEYYLEEEVFRVLRKKGLFITKQVDSDNDKDLAKLLGTSLKEENWHLESAVTKLEKVGFTIIEKLNAIQHTRFYDVGAIVYYLKIVPWAIPDFTLEKYRTKLFDVHRTIVKKGYIEVRNPRFMIIAKKE
ncbi:MAG: SAM-dependent methyltransferase [Candidatus Heimdallarchaeaceae archaeon]